MVVVHVMPAFVQQSVDAAHAVVLAGYIAQSTHKLKLVIHLRFMHFFSTFRGRRSSKKQFLLSTFELYGIHHASFHCRKLYRCLKTMNGSIMMSTNDASQFTDLQQSAGQ